MSSRRLPIALLAAAVLGVGLTLVPTPVPEQPGQAGQPEQAGQAGRAGRAEERRGPGETSSSALEVLRAWDRQRAAAYAAGSPERLRRLYVPGSSAGRADVRLLQRYAARGLRVVRMRTALLALDVLDRRLGLLRLRVTDRLADGVAVGATSQTRLPRDAATTRTLTLMRGAAGRWRLAAASLSQRRAQR